MKKILLINPPWVIGEDKNLWKEVASSWPSLGLAYIASVLEQDNHKVYYLDCSAEQLTVGDTKKALEKYQDLDFIGITVTTPLVKNGLAIAKEAKEMFPDSKIVFGGVHASILPEEILGKNYVDYVIVDEGEDVMRELVSGKEAREIQSLCYKKDGQIIKNSLRPLRENLDDIPPPAYHLLPIDKYHPPVGGYKRLPAMSILATRGCPGRCTFCCRTFRGRVRKRSADNIIKEIRILQKDYGVKEIAFYDDTFTIFEDLVKEFCDKVIKEKIDITWSCFTRVDRVNEELLRKMKKAGCHAILIGVESADEQILKNINKMISLNQVRTAVHLARKIGIETRAAFMLGNQGETEETIKKTIKYAIDLDPDEAIFNIAIPYPGTEMFDWAKKNNYIKSFDWNDYSYSNVVLELPNLDRKKLQYFYNLAYRKFYFRPRIVWRRLLNIRSWQQLLQEIKGALAVFKFLYDK